MELEKYFKYKVVDNALSGYRYGDWNEEDVVYAIEKELAYKANVGHSVERIEHNEREKAFFEEWLHENEPVAGINNGHGILQDLFIERIGVLQSHRWITEITPRERMIVATIIQWLGSNVGMGFLYAALRRFNARIVYDEKPNREQELERSVANTLNQGDTASNLNPQTND